QNLRSFPTRRSSDLNPDRAHLLSHVLRNLLCTPLGPCLRKTGNDFVVNRQTQIRGEASAVQLHQSPAGDIPARALHHVVQSRVRSEEHTSELQSREN